MNKNTLRRALREEGLKIGSPRWIAEIERGLNSFDRDMMYGEPLRPSPYDYSDRAKLRDAEREYEKASDIWEDYQEVLSELRKVLAEVESGQPDEESYVELSSTFSELKTMGRKAVRSGVIGDSAHKAVLSGLRKALASLVRSEGVLKSAGRPGELKLMIPLPSVAPTDREAEAEIKSALRGAADPSIYDVSFGRGLDNEFLWILKPSASQQHFLDDLIDGGFNRLIKSAVDLYRKRGGSTNGRRLLDRMSAYSAFTKLQRRLKERQMSHEV